MRTPFLVLIFAALWYMRVSNVDAQEAPANLSIQTCNTCCKGETGSAGINGISGNNGLPGRDGRDGLNGRDGLKGDSGSKGDKGAWAGERGPIGPAGSTGLSGEKGQQGLRGPAGNDGPMGPIGSVGPVGPKGSKGSVGPIGTGGSRGIKGDKGSIGITGATGRIRESAFSVYKTTNQVTTSVNEIVTFDGAHVNIGGHFNLARNRFICQIPGTYVLSYSAYVTEAAEGDNPDLRLYKNGFTMAHARTETGNIQIGQSVILELQNGNEVWLQLNNNGEGIDGNEKCLFSGFLLYEH